LDLWSSGSKRSQKVCLKSASNPRIYKDAEALEM